MTKRIARSSQAGVGALSRTVGVVVTVLVMIAVAAQPAAAHRAEQNHTWYSDNAPTCQHAISALDHGNGNGHVYMEGKAVKHAWNFDCWVPLEPPAGAVFAKWRLFKWTGVTWAFCNQGGGVHNASGDNKAISMWDLPSGAYFCGTGSYSNLGETWHDIGNGRVGGTLSSGSHQLPTF